MNQRASHMFRLGRAAAAAACVMLLAGCAETPDWANPVEWYRSAASVFEDEPSPDVAKAREEAKKNEATSPGSDQSFPKLSSVPDRPKDLGAESKNVQQGLAADRADARHVDVDTGPDDEASGSSGSSGSGTASASGSSSAGSSATNGGTSSQSGNQASNQASDTPPPAPPATGTSSSSAAGSPSGTPSRAPTAPQVAAAGDSGTPTGMASGGTPQAPAPAPATAAPMAPSQVTSAPPSETQDAEQVRKAFEAALNQSAPTVTTAPAGVRDMHHSPVVTRTNTMPVPPSSMGGRDVVLRPPAGVKPLHSAEAHTVVYFGNDSSRLSGRAVNKLKNIVNDYKKHGGMVRIVGHASSRTRNTDEMTHRLVNFRISLDRAEAVARELSKLGVPADKVEVKAVADNDPVYYEVMPAGEAGNRRAEIFLDY